MAVHSTTRPARGNRVPRDKLVNTAPSPLTKVNVLITINEGITGITCKKSLENFGADDACGVHACYHTHFEFHLITDKDAM